MKKKQIASIAAVALLTVGIGGHAWAFGDLKVNTTVNNNRDHSTRSGRDMTANSNNRSTTNKNDNRSWKDSRNMSDNRNLSDNRRTDTHTTTTSTDSRNMSDNRNYSDNSNRSDNRNMSDNSNRSDNRVAIDNRRDKSHNLGDNSIMINGGYKPRVGHDNASTGTISGSNNVVDNSVSGNFGIGHTTNVSTGSGQ